LNDVRRLLRAAPSAHPVSSLRLNEKDSRRADDNMIDIPILSPRKIMKGPITAVGDLLQRFRHGLFAAQPKPKILGMFKTPYDPDRRVCSSESKDHARQGEGNWPKPRNFARDAKKTSSNQAQTGGDQQIEDYTINYFIKPDG
jgi:hypothetical protein